ncbi:MAG: Gfo/Idh/MocA family oxidoreductase [Opitutus sp.]|nr:Gfo/Idh/MocA family oxidoreductase [Opitutus sp.]
MSQHSVLIVGCGSIGERHVRCFLRTGRATVAASDTMPSTLERIAKTYDVKTSGDWLAEAQSGRHTIAVICTPASLHVEMARQALAAGLHVLIEKPLSHSLAGIDALLTARDHSERQVALAYVYHTFPVLREAGAFIAENRFGPILHGVATSGQAFHRLRPAYAKTYYRDRRMGGGAIQDALTHAANWIESVLGPTESVLCDCAHLALPEVDVEDTVIVSARHARDLCSYSLNQFQAPNESYLQFNAAGGSVRIELHRQRWGTFTPDSSDWDWRPAAPVVQDGHFITQANAFLDQVEGRAAPLCSLEAGIQTLRFNLAALASANSGTRVACATIS